MKVVMDFVDLDRVLDEFEEEEKAALSIVPGQELKPSGYIEFLQKHQEQEWQVEQPEEPPFSNSLLPSATTPVSPATPLSPPGVGQQRLTSSDPPSSLSYDDPFPISKLSFSSDNSSLTRDGFNSLPTDEVLRNKSEMVTSLTTVGEVKTVLKRSTSNHKGTIASKDSQMQTDALSPDSERNLAPFPHCDLLIEGHPGASVMSCNKEEEFNICVSDVSLRPGHEENTVFRPENNASFNLSISSNVSDIQESLGDTSAYDRPLVAGNDNNHSPMYASVDSSSIIDSSQPPSKSQQFSFPTEQSLSVVNEPLANHNNLSQCQLGSNINLTKDHVNPGTLPVSLDTLPMTEQAVGFSDPVDQTLDDSELTDYLDRLDGGSLGDDHGWVADTQTHILNKFDNSYSKESGPANNSVDTFSENTINTGVIYKDDANVSIRNKSISEDRHVYSLTNSQTNESDLNIESADTTSTIVVGQEHVTELIIKNLPLEINNTFNSNEKSIAEEFREVNGFNNPSLVLSNSNNVLKSQSPDLVTGLKKNLNSDAGIEENNTVTFLKTHTDVYQSLLTGKLEIEQLLEDRAKREVAHSTAVSIGESLVRGKMEIERILEEVVQNQQDMSSTQQQLVEKPYNKLFGHSLPDVTNNPNKKTLEVTKVKDANSSPSPDPTSSSPLMHGSLTMSMGIGARPKDPSFIKKARPNSLQGLSKINFDPTASVVRPAENEQTLAYDTNTEPSSFVSPMKPVEQNLVEEEEDPFPPPNQEQIFSPPPSSDFPVDARQRTFPSSGVSDLSSDAYPPSSYGSTNAESKYTEGDDTDPASASQDAGMSKLKRPTSLALPVRPGFCIGQTGDQNDVGEIPESGTQNSGHDAVNGCSEDISAEKGSGGQNNKHSLVPNEENKAETSTESASQAASLSILPPSDIGIMAPFWIPDAEAPACMLCGVKFTMWKRRHHCRACGKVLCATCCSQKAELTYLEGKEARVCVECHDRLSAAPMAPSRSPDPNRPSDYCSKVPPNQQATAGPPPTVMVPTGVLKTSGSQRAKGEPKQVMFSDGIRPGGDLTELDGPDQSRRRRRGAKKSAMRRGREDSAVRAPCIVPEGGLPPLYLTDERRIQTDPEVNALDYTEDYRNTEGIPITYAVNRNLTVTVRVVHLVCCVGRTCWSLVTRGMDTAGQAELVMLMELTPMEAQGGTLRPPRDLFMHLQQIYEDALRGYHVSDMGHSLVTADFLGSRDHGGFLFLRPTHQCLASLDLPVPPFLFGVLLTKWELPWAKVFPVRLMLRLGAEYRYYPCPLVSVRDRKPVFYEVGHTIINLLADFRNFTYRLSSPRGMVIHMGDKRNIISFPRNRYDDVMRAVRSSNEAVLALGSSFSTLADSHLVCIQAEDGGYQTQAINIQNKPRKVTGASFIVFNGALKSSSGLKAKCSIVEDGIMVQILPDAMVAVKEALTSMNDHKIPCGPLEGELEATVELTWVGDDTDFNLGVTSQVDGRSLQGVECVAVKTPTDFLSERLAVRWTSVYFLQRDEGEGDSRDLTKLTEEVASAACGALRAHLENLRQEGIDRLGLRVTLTRDKVGYETGSGSQSLPGPVLNDLDTFLIPIIHQAAEEGVVMELLICVVD